MSSKRYPEEVKIEADRQVTYRGYSVADVACRLDVTTPSLFARLKKYGPDANKQRTKAEEQAEINRFTKELKRGRTQRVTEERDILKISGCKFK